MRNVQYVIWRTTREPWGGPPQDRPADACGVRTREEYDSRTNMSYLDGQPTEVVEEFDASSDEAADARFSSWLDKAGYFST